MHLLGVYIYFLSGINISVRKAFVSKLRSGWHSYYNNAGSKARLKTSFVLIPVTEDKQRTFILLFLHI